VDPLSSSGLYFDNLVCVSFKEEVSLDAATALLARLETSLSAINFHNDGCNNYVGNIFGTATVATGKEQECIDHLLTLPEIKEAGRVPIRHACGALPPRR
jgi:hypothetical protein